MEKKMRDASSTVPVPEKSLGKPGDASETRSVRGPMALGNEREQALKWVWNNDAPQGEAYKCPDCAYWATLGGNAGFHAKGTGHGVPTLVPIKTVAAPPAVEQETVGTTCPLCRAKITPTNHKVCPLVEGKKEPSDGNALNLQMARDVARFTWDEICRNARQLDSAPGIYFDFDNGKSIIERNIRSLLSSHAPESSSGSEFPKTDKILLNHACTLLRASRYALRKKSLNPEVDHAGYFDSVDKLIAVIEHHHDAPYEEVLGSSQSSPLPEGEEDSAPAAQPQSERTKDATGQAKQP